MNRPSLTAGPLERQGFRFIRGGDPPRGSARPLGVAPAPDLYRRQHRVVRRVVDSSEEHCCPPPPSRTPPRACRAPPLEGECRHPRNVFGRAERFRDGLGVLVVAKRWSTSPISPCWSAMAPATFASSAARWRMRTRQVQSVTRWLRSLGARRDDRRSFAAPAHRPRDGASPRRRRAALAGSGCRRDRSAGSPRAGRCGRRALGD